LPFRLKTLNAAIGIYINNINTHVNTEKIVRFCGIPRHSIQLFQTYITVENPLRQTDRPIDRQTVTLRSRIGQDNTHTQRSATIAHKIIKTGRKHKKMKEAVRGSEAATCRDRNVSGVIGSYKKL
jgi:hypothetical protein